MPKDKLIHTQSHVGRVLKAFNEADIRIAEIVFTPDGAIPHGAREAGRRSPGQQ